MAPSNELPDYANCEFCGSVFVPTRRTNKYCCPTCQERAKLERQRHPDNIKRPRGMPADEWTFIEVQPDSSGDNWPKGRFFNKLDIRSTLDYCGWPTGAIAMDKKGRKYRVEYLSGYQVMRCLDDNSIIRGACHWSNDAQHPKKNAIKILLEAAQ